MCNWAWLDNGSSVFKSCVYSEDAQVAEDGLISHLLL